MNAFGYDVDAYIEETLLQVQTMQQAFDKTVGLDPPVKLVVKHMLYTPEGETDPWGWVSSHYMSTLLDRFTDWVQTNPPQLANIPWDGLHVTTMRDESFYGTTGYAWTATMCTQRSIASSAVTKDLILEGATLMARSPDGQSIYTLVYENTHIGGEGGVGPGRGATTEAGLIPPWGYTHTAVSLTRTLTLDCSQK